MANIEDFQIGKRLLILQTGETGSGKSIQAASFPKIYFFDFDGRIDSVAHHFRKLGKKDIEYDFYGKIEFSKALLKVKSFKSYNPYRAICFDTITSIGDSLLKTGEINRGGKGSNQMAGFSVPTLEDYGAESAGFTELLDACFELDCHVIFNAHLMIAESGGIMQGGTKMSRSIVTGGKKIAAKIPSRFNEVYMYDPQPSPMQGGKPLYTIITQHSTTDFAKSALGLPGRLDVTTKLLYEHLCDYVPGMRDADETPIAKSNFIKI